MKPLPLILVCAAVAAIVSFTAVALRAPSSPAQAATPAAVSPDDSAQLARAVADLQKQNADVQRALDELRLALASSDRGSRIPTGEIDAAVARALSANGAAAPAASEKPAAPAKTRDAKSLLAELEAQGLSWDDAQKLWKEAAELGLVDELVALYEQTAKDRPNDPEAQLDLGNAFLQKVFKAGGGPEAGIWAVKADKAFDAALALDGEHWQARFQKAVSLSFWPPMLGKQGAAVKEFETLLAQQKNGPVQAQHAHTHLYLGNMYQQMGQGEKALAAWKAGLDLFPNNKELAAQIANAQTQ